MRPHPSLLPFLFVFLWSTGFIGAKLGLPYAEPLTFLLARYLLILALMTTFAVLTRAPWPADGRQVFHIGVSGLLVHALYLGGVFTAIRHGLPAGVHRQRKGPDRLVACRGHDGQGSLRQ